MAARLLGVSQTALDRWVASGDVPVVVGVTGRSQVPLEELVKLIVSMRSRALTKPERHPLAQELHERRRRAQLRDLTSASSTDVRRDYGHTGAETRSLAYHRIVASMLDEELIEDARLRLRRWCDEGRIDSRNASRWQQILSRCPEAVARAIARNDEHSRQLRQSSPFAGALSEPERRRLLAALR
jgi:hypothetical protein